MTHPSRRVLHVVGGMVRAGVETWLMHALRRVDRRRLQMEFLHHFSGYLLWLARRSGVQARIAHSHSDTRRQDARAPWLRGTYLRVAKESIRRNATHRVAASRSAGRALFGDTWETDPRKRILRRGADLAAFREAPQRQAARERLGIANYEFVIGHTGRFVPAKNHGFLAEIAAVAALRRPRLRVLLIGDGPGRRPFETRLRSLGIAARAIFVGIRGDVPALLKAIVPGLTSRVSLSASALQSASATLDARRPSGDRELALSIVEKSSFNIQSSVEQLYAVYHA